MSIKIYAFTQVSLQTCSDGKIQMFSTVNDFVSICSLRLITTFIFYVKLK